MPAARPFLPIPLLVVVFCLLWSSAFAGAKLALASSPPLLLLAARFVLAGFIMLALARLVDGPFRLGRRDLGALFIIGALNNALYLGFNWVALTHATSAYTAVLTSCLPLLVALAAGPVLGERLSLSKWLGIGLGLAGVVIVLRSRLSGGHETLAGTALLAMGCASLAAGTIAFKYLKPRGGVWLGTAVQCLAGATLVLPVALATESLGDVRFDADLVFGLAYLVVAVSVGGYGLWFYLLTRSSATAASSLHFLMPPLGLFFGWVLLGEQVPPLDVVGIVPIALGIYMVTRPTRATPQAAAASAPCIPANNA
ncbi:MAG TPA: DMT family transporter [Xanthobacteraceae bacterium]|nr:DMT family transporter [Xanthobacteraceae bacterium]